MIENKKQTNHFLLTLLIILCGTAYIFFYQFRLPFRADSFLAGMSVGLVALTLLNRKIVLPKQTLVFVLVNIASAVGVLYSTRPTEGFREAVLFLLFTGIFVLSASNLFLIEKFIQVLHWMSIFVVATSIIQFLLPGTFHDLMDGWLRDDAYQQLIWSYSVDDAYAGIAAYTPNTTFSAAIVCGHALLNLMERRTHKRGRSAVNICLMGMSLYTMVLCSKRGIFVATMAAIVLLYCYLNQRRDVLLKLLGIVAVSIVAVLVLYQTNEYVAAFVNRFLAEDFLTGRGKIYSTLLSDFWNGNILFGRGTGATYALADTGAHNIYFQILYDHGLVLSLPYFLFLAYNLCTAFRNECPLSIFMQTIFLVYGLSGNPLYSSMFMIMYVYYVLYAVKMPSIKVLAATA